MAMPKVWLIAPGKIQDRVCDGCRLTDAWVPPDTAPHPLQMGQEIRRQFVTKNQIHLPRQQQIVDRGHQPQASLVAEVLPLQT